MVTCHRNVDMAMWCLKSFSYYARESPHITIHDDGTLTAQDKGLLRDHFDRCTVVDKAEADERMDKVLIGHPLCRQMRAKSDFYCALKLFDPAVYALTDVILLIDSDILFFQRPSELLDCVGRGSPCFSSDYQDAYAVPGEELRRHLGIDVLPSVNLGLAVMRRADYDFDFMERYFACFPVPIRDVNRHEQTLYALLMSTRGAHRLGSAYQLSRQPINEGTVSHHFVNDGSRVRFSTRGVSALRRSGLFAEIAGMGVWEGADAMESASSRRKTEVRRAGENPPANASCPPDDPVVVFVADDRFAMPLAAAMSSVIANLGSGRSARIFIIDGGISQANREKVMRSDDRKRVRVQWLPPTDSHRDLLRSFPCGYLGRIPYYKLLIPDLLGPEYSRAIYLDCDVIVERDIADLWNVDPGENLVMAAQDLINPFVSSPFGLRNWRELGRKANDGLFNSGVLVLNAAKWRQENVIQRLARYLRDHYRDVQLCDQDAMNAVLGDRRGKLDSLWNVLPYMSIARKYTSQSRTDHENLLANAYILHFCGPIKPWSTMSDHPRRDRFFHYLDMTAWSGWRPRWWSPNSDVLAYYVRRVLAVLGRRSGRGR
jgi:lipopolysaccharide biosynthesis glycosyltransferase